MSYTDEDARRYAQFIVGHPDAKVDARHLAAARAVLDGLTQDGRLLPPEAETEWGFRCTDSCGRIHPQPEDVARRMAKHVGRALVNRPVGQWIEVTDGG